MKYKKILLSITFIAVFGVYIIYEKYNANTNQALNTVSVAMTNSLPPNPIKSNSAGNLSSTQAQTSIPAPASTPIAQSSGYKDGQYTGNSVNVFYGQVQVLAVISGGKITDIKFLNYPQDNRNSLSRSNYALPQLKTEAIQAQSANVNAISGATETSSGFIQSLSSALLQAS